MTGAPKAPNGKAWLGIIFTSLTILGIVGGWAIAVASTYYDYRQWRIQTDKQYVDMIKSLDMQIQDNRRANQELRDDLNGVWEYLQQQQAQAITQPKAGPVTGRGLENSNRDLRKRVQDLERRMLNSGRGGKPTPDH